MCNVNVVNRISRFCFIMFFFLEWIGGGFGHPGHPLATPLVVLRRQLARDSGEDVAVSGLAVLLMRERQSILIRRLNLIESISTWLAFRTLSVRRRRSLLVSFFPNRFLSFNGFLVSRTSFCLFFTSCFGWKRNRPNRRHKRLTISCLVLIGRVADFTMPRPNSGSIKR